MDPNTYKNNKSCQDHVWSLLTKYPVHKHDLAAPYFLELAQASEKCREIQYYDLGINATQRMYYDLIYRPSKYVKDIYQRMRYGYNF